MAQSGTNGTVDAGEIARFAKAAPRWWDEAGEFRPLHRLNPVRLQFIRDRLAGHFRRDVRAAKPFAGLRLLDIGCGGGLVAEPMARLGFAVTGIDADTTALDVARAHAAQSGLEIDYRAAAVEDLDTQFDAVLALEVAEHASDPALFLDTIARLVAQGGAFAGSTLNRTAKSFLFAIVGAEYVLRWLPRGTHRWAKFLAPSEVAAALRGGGLSVRAVEGLNYDPLHDLWKLGRDTGVNYLIFAIKPK